MFGIKIKNEFLDLPQNFVIEFQLNNQVFSSSDNDLLPGSFQIPTNLVLTNKNKRLLNNPHLPQNADNLMEDEPAEIWAGGGMLWEGLLTIQNAQEKTVRIYTVIAPFKELKNENITDLDLGGDRVIGQTSLEVRIHAEGTTVNPLSHDYIFFPVYNYRFQSEKKYIGSPPLFQNYWDDVNQEFFEGEESPAAMPFVRVEYLLDKIFEGFEYTFINNWQTTDELKMLVMYNNFSIYEDPDYDPDANPPVDPLPDTWGRVINLVNHLPKVKSNKFLKDWMRIFGLGLFVDFHARTVELIPVRNLLERSPSHDWSDKLLREYTINKNKLGAPDAYSFDIEDEVSTEFDRLYERPTDYVPVLDIEDVPPFPPANSTNVYYVENRDIFVISGAFPARPSRKALDYSDLGVAPRYNTDNEVSIDLAPLHDFFFGELDSNGNAILVTYDKFEYSTPPEVRAFPAIYYLGTIEEVRDQKAEVPYRFTMYRGIYNNRDGNPHPYANGMPYDPQGNKIGDYSIHWTSPTGLYEQWHRQWHEMLRYGKNVNMIFNLKLSDLLKFSFKDKVIVGNLEYFVKSINVKFSRRGLLPVQMELVSVI